MIRFLLTFVFIYVIFRLLWPQKPRRRIKTESSTKELVQDPHCQIYFPRENAHRLKLEGETYYFCSRECLEAFRNGEKDKPK